jgi:hypothetical protein
VGRWGGFSLNAEVRVSGKDRAGLERLLRYCARPVFASERLEWLKPDPRWVYRLPKPRPSGQTVLYLTPSEFLNPLALLVPPPRKHRHRYHGVLAPNAPLRSAVTAYAGLPVPRCSLRDCIKIKLLILNKRSPPQAAGYFRSTLLTVRGKPRGI